MKGLTKITRRVSLIIFYNRNKILLQYRGDFKKSFGEEWGFFGGKIEKGETPEQALLRETKEELDYNLKKDEYKFIGEITTRESRGRYDISSHKFVYISPLKNKLSLFTQHEGSRMQLFSLEECLSLKMGPGDHEVIKRLMKIPWLK